MPETGPTGPAAPSTPEPTLREKALSLMRGLLLNPPALLILLATGAAGMGEGITNIMWPKLGLSHGVSSSAYASIVAMCQVAMAAIGVGCGVVVDKLGADKVYLASQLLCFANKLAMSVFIERHQVTRPVYVAILVSEVFCGQVKFVSYLAFCMRLCCSSLAAATQYCVMMACSNLANTGGTALVATGILGTTREWFWLSALLTGVSSLFSVLLAHVVSMRNGEEGGDTGGKSNQGTGMLL